MPELTVSIGGRDFTVACQDGEETFLQAAATVLDAEAQAIVPQGARVTEARLLLMAGLMLADRTAGMEERLRNAEARAAQAEAALEELLTRPEPVPERIEVPVIPEIVLDTLAEIAARAEALAGELEERIARAS